MWSSHRDKLHASSPTTCCFGRTRPSVSCSAAFRVIDREARGSADTPQLTRRHPAADPRNLVHPRNRAPSHRVTHKRRGPVHSASVATLRFAPAASGGPAKQHLPATTNTCDRIPQRTSYAVNHPHGRVANHRPILLVGRNQNSPSLQQFPAQIWMVPSQESSLPYCCRHGDRLHRMP